MKAVIFGAGNIGRGFLGLLLSRSGHSVTFVDVNEEQVALINRDRAYPVYVVGSTGTEEQVVMDARAVSANDSERLTRELVEVDLILTAVGKKALVSVGKVLGKGLIARLKARPREEVHVIVVACENVHDNTGFLLTQILESVEPAQRDAIVGSISFPNCMVDRIVPNLRDPVSSPLAVWVEDYCRLAIDKAALRGPFPEVAGVELVDNLPALLEQKLYTLNMAHAVVGYLGWLAGYEFVHDAVVDYGVRELLSGCFDEVSRLLCFRHASIIPAEQRAFAESVIRRFSNTRLRDALTRVTSDPRRKLGPSDRLVSPAVLLASDGYNPSYLTAGVAATFSYRNDADREACEIEGSITERGIAPTIESVCGLDSDSQLSRAIASHYLLRSL